MSVTRLFTVDGLLITVYRIRSQELPDDMGDLGGVFRVGVMAGALDDLQACVR